MLFDNDSEGHTNYISEETARILSSAVVQAYKYVWNMGSTFMFSPEAQGVGGHMRRAAVAAFVLEVVNQNSLPFHPYIITTGHKQHKTRHLLLMSNDQKMAFSLNQVSSVNAFPKRADYREKLIERNLFQLAMDFHPLAPSPYPVEWKYYMLLHGYRSETPLFVAFGMPFPNNKWGVRPVDILAQSRHQFFVSEETIEKKIAPKLKKQFETKRGLEL